MRRTKNKYFFRLVPFLLACVLSAGGCGRQGESGTETEAEYKRDVFAMGTYMTLTAYGDSAAEALTLAENRIEELEALWSVTDAGSDIYRVNHSGGIPTKVSGETAEVLRFALAMAEQTGGAFDPTISPVITAWGFLSGEYAVPARDDLEELLTHVGYEKVIMEKNLVTLPEGTELDLGAVGKGYAGDMISAILKEQGVAVWLPGRIFGKS